MFMMCGEFFIHSSDHPLHVFFFFFLLLQLLLEVLVVLFSERLLYTATC